MLHLARYSPILVAAIFAQSAAWANAVSPPYDKLNLNGRQQQQIDQLENEWNSKYNQLQPELQTAQKRLFTLLSKPKADPLEITAVQQQINQLKENLSEFATANFLKKKRVLTSTQQQALEQHLRRMVADRRQKNKRM